MNRTILLLALCTSLSSLPAQTNPGIRARVLDALTREPRRIDAVIVRRESLSMRARMLRRDGREILHVDCTVTPVEQANKALPAGSYTRGDVLRITLEVNASADMTWAVITDPVPAGATILGSGLGRDSEIATKDEKRDGDGWGAFEERSFESFRSYYEYLPKGIVKMEYTIRLNNVGEFSLPPTRVEAMYAPEMFGEAPNGKVKVEAGK